MALDVGIEVPSADLVALLGAGLGDLPRLLDASGASYAVIGADRAGRGGSLSASPTVIGTLLARRTGAVGIVVATSPQRDHPYNAARRVASIDHVSGGRAGLLVLQRDRSLDLGIGERSAWVPGDLATTQLVDALVATRKLWRTWPIESLDSDPEVAGAARLPFADHVGVFSTKGPLNVPTTPQGEPVVFWLASPADTVSEDEIETAATVADVVLVDYDALATLAPARLTSIIEASAAAGRPAKLHVRVWSAGADIAEVVAGLAARPDVAGVAVRTPPAALAGLAGEVLPHLAASGTVTLRAAGTRRTLRDLLAIPRRAEPDLSANPIAFPAVSKEPA
jgi:alkanesulfonate monooxygenase SsuD/methylene tetrahydromethanopterin reductase-like flavin-dependent oxidoreductase (luciferase family)